MSELEKAREIINTVDKTMAQLFENRMEAAKIIAEYKKNHGLPILDKSRESEVVLKNSEYIKNEEIKSFYMSFIRETMKISRAYQHMLVEGAKVAYSGVEGAFANIAARRIFPDAIAVGFDGFKKAYDAVESGKCDCAVLPVENSSAGEVGQVIDIIFSGSLKVVGMFDIEVNQNLLGVPGASISDITNVISHPQALSQSEEYLKTHGVKTKEAINTAVAAKLVSEMCDIHTAAVASEETAELYGLCVLERKINEDSLNTTRFAVLSRAGAKVGETENVHTMLMFTVKNEAGALAKAINVIGKHGCNMTALRSRPMKELMWEYYFYIEIDGVATDKMMVELKNYCDKLKIAGTYKNSDIKKVKP